MADKMKPGWEYDEEDEEILGIVKGEESEMPATADEALKRAKGFGGGKYEDLKDEADRQFMAGAAYMYEQTLLGDLSDDFEDEMPRTMRRMMREFREHVKQQVLDWMLSELDELLGGLLDVENDESEKDE